MAHSLSSPCAWIIQAAIALAVPRLQSGSNWFSKQEIVQEYIRKHSGDYEKWQELSDLMWYDVGYEVEPTDVPQSLEEWAKADAVVKRGLYACWPCLSINFCRSIKCATLHSNRCTLACPPAIIVLFGVPESLNY